jgi:phenylalanine-4-hydroxylase
MEPPDGYWQRRAEVAALAAGADASPADIAYTDVENAVWETVAATLGPLWDRHAAADVLAGRERLDLPVDRVPQLSEVSARLAPLTGFTYRALPGLVPVEQFFSMLAASTFASTQYVRWEGSPLYTPEPDVIHEVMGHGTCLACPQIAELHRLAGAAITAADDDATRQFVADVFWFSVEFGVLRDAAGSTAPKAYGTGLLSSPGELAWFVDHAEVRPLDVEAMGATGYDIDHYQPVLFAGQSLDHVLDVVGGYFADVAGGGGRHPGAVAGGGGRRASAPTEPVSAGRRERDRRAPRSPAHPRP